MYVALARTVLTDVDRDKISQEVRRFRQTHPGWSNDELVNRLIRQTAVRCAAIAAVASAPPGYLAIIPLAADYSYQVLALNRLVLTIARIYGRPTTHVQRGATVGTAMGLGGGAEFLRRNVIQGIERALRRQKLAHMMPVIGSLVGSAFTYASVRAVGRAARDYYRPRRAAQRAAQRAISKARAIAR